jgi:hypothetical protein
MAEPGDDPALRDEYPRLDLRLVSRLARACGDDGGVVVRREVEQRRVDVGVVPIRPGHRAPELIGYEDLGNTAEEVEPSHDRADEVGALLRPRRFCERVVARAEHHDEEFDLDDLAGCRIDDRRSLARVVDERLLARAVRLPHDEVEPTAPAVVALAELRVLVRRLLARAALGCLDVLGPDELQGHAGPTELLVHPVEVDRRAWQRRPVLRLLEQPRLERGVGQRLRVRPAHSARPGTLEVVAHGARAQPARRCDLPVGPPALELQPKDFTNLAHGLSLRHGLALAHRRAGAQPRWATSLVEAPATAYRPSDRVSPKSAIGSAETRDRV